MKLSAKEWLVILIGVLFASWIPLLSKLLGFGLENNNSLDLTIFLIIIVSSIIIVVYRRIGEIEDDIEIINKNLRINEEFINIGD